MRNASNSSNVRICWLPSLDALSFDLFYGVYLKEQLTDCFVKLADINAVATGNLTLEMCYQLSDDDVQLELQKSAIEGDSQFEFLVTVNFEPSLNPPKISNLSEVEGRMSRVVVLLETTENGTSELGCSTLQYVCYRYVHRMYTLMLICSNDCGIISL